MTGQASVNVPCRGCGHVWDSQRVQPGRVYTLACPDCGIETVFRVGPKGYRVIRVLAQRETKEVVA